MLKRKAHDAPSTHVLDDARTRASSRQRLHIVVFHRDGAVVPVGECDDALHDRVEEIASACGTE